MAGEEWCRNGQWLQVCSPVNRFSLPGGVLTALGQAIWRLSQAESAAPKPES
jgi:hypothetical protein